MIYDPNGSRIFHDEVASSLGTFLASRFRLGWILIAVAAINAFGWMMLRWSFENSLTSTQITVDYDDTRTMADAFQVSHLKLLSDMKERGVTSVGLYQQTLANLRDNGRITILTRAEAERLYPEVRQDAAPLAYRYAITTTPENQDLLQQILRHLEDQSQPSLPPRRVDIVTAPPGRPGDSAPFLILIHASKQLLNDAQMGFDPAQVKAAQKVGLEITARISNALNLNLTRVRTLLDEAKAVGARVVIFAEDEVGGYDSMIKEVAREMRQRDLIFGTIEFTKQRGWPAFARQTEGVLVRVHSVAGDEAAKAAPDILVDRFTRAVKERNIRVAYIRLPKQFKGEYPDDEDQDQQVQNPSAEGKTALEQNLEFVETISNDLTAQPLPSDALRPGLVMGGAQAFGDYPFNQLESLVRNPLLARIVFHLGLFITGLGALGAALLVLSLFFSRRAQTRWLLIGLPIIAVLSLSAGMGAKLMALVIGCLFPVIGILWGGLTPLWFAPKEDELEERWGKSISPNKAFLQGFGILVKTSLLTMIGSLLIIALLNHWKYMSKADEFLGEKATQLLPLVLVALAFAGSVFPRRVLTGGSRAARRRVRAQIDRILANPFTVRLLAISLLVVVGGYIWIARTGNESGMEISSMELKLRTLLEQILITRPRTKEVFLGHPAVILATWFMLRRRWIPAFAATIVATIGQADLLNTFCHIHTPIFYSLLRSIHAIWLGALIGGIALWIYVRITEPRIFKPVRFGAATFTPPEAGSSPAAPLEGSGGHPTQRVPEERVGRTPLPEHNGAEHNGVPPVASDGVPNDGVQRTEDR